MTKSMAPISAGFSVMYDIDIIKFEHWYKRSGLRNEDYDEIFDAVHDMLTEWQDGMRREHAPYEEGLIEQITVPKLTWDKWQQARKQR